MKLKGDHLHFFFPWTPFQRLIIAQTLNDFFSWLMDILFKNIRIFLSNVQIEEKILLLFFFLQLLLPEATGGCDNIFSTFNQDYLRSL